MPEVRTKKIEPPTIEPLSTDARIAAASARVDSLRDRARSVERRMRGGNVVSNDFVERLLADPRATLDPAPDVTQLAAEHRALVAAVEVAEKDRGHLLNEISTERCRAMRPVKARLARELLAVL